MPRHLPRSGSGGGVNLAALFARGRALLPDGAGGEQQPAAFVASEPGGASAPLIWIVVVLCSELIFIVACAALAGLKSAQWFCEPSRLLAFSSLLGVLVPSLCAYRSFNKHVAAKVAIAQAQGTPAAGEAKP